MTPKENPMSNRPSPRDIIADVLEDEASYMTIDRHANAVVWRLEAAGYEIVSVDNRVPYEPGLDIDDPEDAAYLAGWQDCWVEVFGTYTGDTPTVEPQACDSGLSRRVPAGNFPDTSQDPPNQITPKANRQRRTATRTAVVKAMQSAWDEFVADTSCYPDCFRAEGKLLYADFERGSFATWVADNLLAAEGLLLTAEQDRLIALGKAVEKFKANWNPLETFRTNHDVGVEHCLDAIFAEAERSRGATT